MSTVMSERPSPHGGAHHGRAREGRGGKTADAIRSHPLPHDISLQASLEFFSLCLAWGTYGLVCWVGLWRV
jgi:hypothetical protein